MNYYDARFKKEMQEWIVELFPIGTRVVMSKKWIKNSWNHDKRGTVVGYQRKLVGPIVVHDGKKSPHYYRWSFIVPETKQAPGGPNEARDN